MHLKRLIISHSFSTEIYIAPLQDYYSKVLMNEKDSFEVRIERIRMDFWGHGSQHHTKAAIQNAYEKFL